MAEENKKNKIEINKKDGVAYLREMGLKEVSDKTFINQDNLTTLLDKDFENINKTKAFGFIQILEREFDVDLSVLKNEYLQFSHAHKKAQIVVEEKVAVEKKVAAPTSFQEAETPKNLWTYALLGLAALVGLYYMFSGTGETAPRLEQPTDLNVVKNEMVTQEAKESLLALDEAYEKEVNESDEIDLNKVVEEMFKNSDINTSDVASLSTENNETNDKNISKVATQEEQESTIQTALKAPAEEESIHLAQVKETVQTAAPIVEKPVWKERQVSKTKVTPKKVKNSQQSGLYIDPIRKAWVGVIYLDTMKKKDYLIRNRLKLDSSKDQIILVGHKNFKIFNHKLERGFKSKKMVRFLYRDGELTELSKSEYLDYLGSARW